MPAPTVHVIDDNASVREALESLLGSVGLQCRLYGSPLQFLESGPPEGPGCIVVDVRMPGMSGLDFQDCAHQLGVAMPTILITGHGDVEMSVRAMKAGASDFLAKPFRDQDMLDAVFAAIEKDERRLERQREGNVLKRRAEKLTTREFEVMALVAAGKMNKQVAFELHLSEVTVKVHRGSMMRKMGARNLPELVRMVDRLGIDCEGVQLAIPAE